MKRSIAAVFVSISFAQQVALAQVVTSVPTQSTPQNNSQANSPNHPNTSATQSQSPVGTIAGQTRVIDFGQSSTLSIPGSLTNAGTLYLVSTNSNVTTGTLSAANIFNQAGATISSILPPSIANTLGSHVANFSFVLSAVNNIVNAGTISSAGSLSLVAGGSITNGGTALSQFSGSTMAPGAVIQAANNLSLFSATGVINNSGLISSLTGNVALNSRPDVDLIINNVLGQISAAGAVNVRDIFSAGSASTAIIGGDVLSEQLNVCSGNGHIAIDMNNVSGTLNLFGADAQVRVAGPSVALGQLALSGDPTFYNTTGSFLINTDLVFSGAPLAIVANGDITTGVGVGRIDTSSATTNAGPITLIAGVNITTSGPAQTSNPFTPVSLTITGASGSGGKIDLVGANPITSLMSNSTAKNGSGADLTLIAYSGTAATSGNISLPANVVLDTRGNGAGVNGNVTILGKSIISGDVNTMGGSGGGGNVTLSTGNPTGNSSGPCSSCVYISNSALSNGSIFAVTTGAGTGSISAGKITAPGSTVTVLAGGTLLTQAILNDGLSGQAGGTVALKQGAATPFAVAAATGDGVAGSISAKGGAIAGKGGAISIDTPGTLTLQSGSLLQVQPVAGTGGNISIKAGDLNLSSGNLTANAAGGNFQGGLISLTFGGFTAPPGNCNFSANGSGTGNGGEVDITFQTNGQAISFAPGNGNFGVSATSGLLGGNGGVFKYNGGNSGGGLLTINPAAINISPLGLVGDGGTFRADPGFGSISFTNAVSAMLAPGATQGSGGSFFIDNPIIGSGLNVVIPGGTISVNGNGPSGAVANGGTVSISARNVSSSTGGPITISADAAGIGNGGSIILQTRNSISIGTGAANAILYARGGSPGSTAGNGGTIYLRSAQIGTQVTIDPASLNAGPRGLNGNGPNLTFYRNPFFGGTFISGNLVADGVGNGNGGRVTIVHGGDFTVAPGTSSNGINGTISAKGGASSGDGGSITLEVDFGQLLLNSVSSLNVSTVKGNGGTIDLVGALGHQTTFSSSPAVLDLSGKNGDFNGGTFIVGSTPNLNPSGNFTINVNGSGVLGKGGSIRIGDANGANINGAAALKLLANGGTAGDGGAIGFQSTTTNVTLGIGAGMIFASATGGSALSNSGNGGRVSIGAPTLTYNPAGLNVNPLGKNGNGGFIALSNLPISFTGGISVDGVGTGDGGSLDLTIGGSVINTALTANSGAAGGAGGSISVSSPSLTVANGNLISVTSTAGKGGTINLSKVVSVTGSLSANASNGNFDGGSISLGTTLSAIPVTSLNANGAGTGKGGSVSINSSNAVLNSFGAVSAVGGANGGSGGSLTLQAPSLAINTSSVNIGPGAAGNGDGGSLTLLTTNNTNVTGNITLDGNGNGNGGQLFIRTGTAGGFTVGSPVAASGVTGYISAIAPGSGNGGNVSIGGTPNPVDLTINSYIDTHSKSGNNGNLNLSKNYNFVNSFTNSISGPGAIIGSAIDSAGTTLTYPVTISLPQQTQPLILGSLMTTGNLSVTAPNVLVPGTVTVSGAKTTFNSATVVNNGLIAATSVLTFSNNSGVKMSGTGTLFAPGIVFQSSQGSVLVNQGNIIGTISGSASGAFNVTFGSVLTSSGVLSIKQISTPGAPAKTVVIDPQLDIVISNQGSIIATDVIRINIPTGSQTKSEGTALNLQHSNSSIVFTAPNQVLTGSSSIDSTTIGEEGTEIAEENGDSTILRKGRILVDNGKDGSVVRTSLAEVRLGAESTSLVESRPDGVTRILAVAGEVVVNPLDQKSPAVTLRPGQDLLLSERELADEELIPVEGNTVVQASIEKRSSHLVTRTLSLRQMTERNIMISGSMVHLSNGSRSQQRRLTEHIYRAIALVEPTSAPRELANATTGSRRPTQRSTDQRPIRTFADAGAKFHITEKSKMEVSQGAVFLEAAAGMVIKTPLADLKLRSPNALSVEVGEDGVSIKACTGVQGIQVVVGNRQISLCSGEELFLSQKALDKKQFASDNIARRNQLVISVPGVRTAIVSEFSIMSLLSRGRHLGSFVQSRSKSDAAQKDRILKCVAALQYARGTGAPFTSN